MSDNVKNGDGDLAKAEWLNAPDTRAVMAALTSEGDVARFVGGCVRNALMHEPVGDIDIATALPPERAMALLQAKGIKVIPTGLAHGTVSAVIGARHFEITTLRVDVMSHGRHADVAFTGDWLEDARRRDFTINALYADMDGTVHDPLGGRADIAARLVRFIGDPHQRIREDYLRILRFFRFQAHYGKGEPDAGSLRACGEERDGLKQLSAERVKSELFRILEADAAPSALRHMAAAGILSIILPEASRLDRLTRLVAIEADQLFVTGDALLRLGSMLELDAAAAGLMADRLRFSTRERERLVAMLTDRTKIVCYLSMREVRRALYVMGLQLFKDRTLLGWASDPLERNAFQWRAMLAMADSWARPVFPLTGEMVKAASVPEGPEIGRVMREVEEWWIDADFIEDEFSIIERLKAVVQATVY